MKNLKLTVPCLALFVLAVSCSKKDLNPDSPVQTPSIPFSVVESSDTTGWQTVTQWQSIKQDKSSVYYFNIADKRITSEVASDGLVLVFKKEVGVAATLPFEEKNGNGSTYWYHQVTIGNLLILSDLHDISAEPDTNNRFKYLIVTPEELKSLEAQGYSRSGLLGLTYEQATKLISFHG